MSDKRRTFGQFETPADVADLVLAFCLRRPGDRVLDPSCGRGAFLARAARLQRWLAADGLTPGDLWGVELDQAAVELAQGSLPEAHIIHDDFFSLAPWSERLFDAIVGNPPYTRAEWFGRLPATPEPSRQLTMFDPAGDETAQVDAKPAEAPYRVDDSILSRRAGLHAHFFVHGTRFLREGGRFGFVVSNSWLDVAYGRQLKQFLLDHYKILALVESNVERWFHDARVNTCVIILEKCDRLSDRLTNRVRLVRLKRPLAELIPYGPDDRQRLSHLERLSARMLPGSDAHGSDFSARVIGQQELAAADRWGVTLRAPAVWRRSSRAGQLQPLKHWATIRRGFTTGANGFFYLDPSAVRQWGIEPLYLRPLLKSMRVIQSRRINRQDCQLQVLSLHGPPPPGGGAAAYVAWGEEQRIHLRRTCAARDLWYRLPDQTPAPLMMAKGIWGRHFVPLSSDAIWVDQQVYQVRLQEGVQTLAAAALLNSAWFGLQLELHGRINFGEGVLWMAGYELGELLLPDPRYLADSALDQLTQAYEPLLGEPVRPTSEELTSPGWQRLNAQVYEILGLTMADGRAVEAALVERIGARQAKAGQGPP